MASTAILTGIGITAVRKVAGPHTIIEFAAGGCRPATDVEKKLFEVLGI